MTQLPPYPSMTELLLSDPVLLIGMLLPFLIIGGVLWFRLRAWRRVNALAARNEQRYDQTRDESAALWREAAARTERMIALLTEIRDLVARIAPTDAPARERREPG
jgi:large-conductance mechanosensitive channel